MNHPLAALFAVTQADDGPVTDGTAPLPEAVADELRIRFARLNEPHTFTAGDLVVAKPGLSRLRDEWRAQPAIVVDTDTFSYPPEAPVEDGASTGRRDIAVMRLVPGQDCGAIFLEDSRTLMPWVPPASAEAL